MIKGFITFKEGDLFRIRWSKYHDYQHGLLLKINKDSLDVLWFDGRYKGNLKTI